MTKRLTKLRNAADLAVTRRVVKALPLWPLVGMSRALALPLAPFSPLARRLRRLDLPELRGMSLGRRMSLAYLARAAGLERHVWRYKFESLPDVTRAVSAIGREHLDQARGCERGLILVTLHGPGGGIQQLWLKQAVPDWHFHLVKRFPDPVREGSHYPLALMFHEIEMRFLAGRVIDVDREMKQAVKVLHAGGALWLAQDVFLREAQPIPFLGRAVRYTMGAARLAEMTDSLLLPMVCTPRLGFRPWLVHFWPPIDPRDGDPKRDLVAALEGMVTAYPEAWDEWKTLEHCKRLASGGQPELRKET